MRIGTPRLRSRTAALRPDPSSRQCCAAEGRAGRQARPAPAPLTSWPQRAKTGGSDGADLSYRRYNLESVKNIPNPVYKQSRTARACLYERSADGGCCVAAAARISGPVGSYREITLSRTVLVAGGAGYIGSHACKALAHAGYTPVNLDRLGYGHREAVRWGPFVEGDLADKPRLIAAMREHGAEAVMHFAAFTYVGESVQKPQLYFRNNVVNTLTLLDAMLEAGVRHIVFSSTCATYGTPEKVPMDESTPQRPVNPYGETKLMIERALHWYGGAYGMTSASLRYFNAAGADPDGETGEEHDPETHLIPLVLQAALGRRPHIDIYGTDYPTPDG